jgi:hypothetical protein
MEATVSRRLKDVEDERMNIANKESLQTLKEYNDAKTVSSLHDIKNYFADKIGSVKTGWIVVAEESKLTFCLIDTKDILNIKASLCVDNELSFVLCVKEKKSE